MRKILGILLSSTIFLFSQSVFAADYTTYFKNYQQIPIQTIQVPTVLDMPLNSTISRDYLVIEDSTNAIQPHAIVSKTNNLSFAVTKALSSNPLFQLQDGDSKTFVDFELNSQTPNETTQTLNFTFAEPITTDQFFFSLSENVQLPTHITIESGDGKVLVNKTAVSSVYVAFPQTTSKSFAVTFYYKQPLRITEVSFDNLSSVASLRFLAKVGQSYKVYSSPVSLPYFIPPESGDLSTTTVVRPILPPTIVGNPSFIAPDTDKDGITDDKDNCPQTANRDQADKNDNKKGDACEDFDLDGVINSIDNCPENPNINQQDKDGDKIGDHCDGAESRFIEQYAFLPWLGIAVGFGIVILLFKFTMNKSDEEKSDSPIDIT